MDIRKKHLFKSAGDNFFLSPSAEIVRPHLCKIGNNTSIDAFFYCTTQLDLGDYIHIPSHCSVIGGELASLKMEHFSGMAAGCRIICASEDFTAGGLVGPLIPKEFKIPVTNKPVHFERFCITGTSTIVMPGVTLGEGSMIGAGSVVTKSTDPWGIYVGSPAKLVKYRSTEDIIKTYDCYKKMGYFKLEYNDDEGFYFDNTKEKIYLDIKISKPTKEEIKSMYALDIETELLKSVYGLILDWIKEHNRTDLIVSKFELAVLWNKVDKYE